MLDMEGASLLASLTFQELSWRRLKASCGHSGGREDVLETLVPLPSAIGLLKQNSGHQETGFVLTPGRVSTQNDNLSEHLAGQTGDGDEDRTTY